MSLQVVPPASSASEARYRVIIVRDAICSFSDKGHDALMEGLSFALLEQIARKALNAATIAEMHRAFREGGRAAILKVMKQQHAAFLKLLVFWFLANLR